jgi:hypothetical protein
MLATCISTTLERGGRVLRGAGRAAQVPRLNADISTGPHRGTEQSQARTGLVISLSSKRVSRESRESLFLIFLKFFHAVEFLYKLVIPGGAFFPTSVIPGER